MKWFVRTAKLWRAHYIGEKRAIIRSAIVSSWEYRMFQKYGRWSA